MSRKTPQHKRSRRAAAAVAMPGKQRGAAAVFAAVALVAMLLSTLLSINIGRLYYAQRDLQKLATAGALAAVESASGCNGAAGLRSTSAATAQVTSIIQANLPSGSKTTAAQLLTKINGIAGVQLGREITTGVNPGSGATDGYYHFLPLADGSSQIDAAVVNLSETTPSLIGAMFFPNFAPLTLHASATAMQQPLGAFSIGSTLASLNTGSSALLNPLLTALLGTSVNLSAIDYNNMASVNLSLANLEVAAGVNDLNSLLALNTNLGGVEQILNAATNQVNPGVANLLTGLTLGTTQASNPVSLAALLGNVATGLNPAVTDAASLVPSLNLLDLLQQVGEQAAAANPNNFLQLNMPSISIPGVLAVGTFLQVQEPMQQGFGPIGTQAQSAQIQLNLRLSVDPTQTGILSAVLGLLNTILSLLGSGITISPINLGLNVQVASTTGTLAALNCPTVATPKPSATIDVNASLVRLQLGTFIGSVTSNSITGGPTLQGGPILQLTGTGLLALASTTIALNNAVPSNNSYLDIGNTAGASAGPFTIYGTPYQPNATIAPSTWYYPACNSTEANPIQCGSTTDPSNPAAPIPTADILSGISTLIGDLFNNDNLVVKLGSPPINLSGILDPIISALNTLLLAPLTQVLDGIIDPLLNLLGVQLASGTVLMNGVETGKQVIVNTNLPGSPNF